MSGSLSGSVTTACKDNSYSLDINWLVPAYGLLFWSNICNIGLDKVLNVIDSGILNGT